MEDIAEDETLTRILNREENVDDLINEVKDWWRYDLVHRRVGAAYAECDVELDLAGFMLTLAERKAVINIPTYTRRRARSIKEGERIVSAKNRHGKIIGVTANKSVFSFSARLQDVNVMTMETVGEPRNFMMVDVDGSWHEGWKTIELLPKAEENAFLHEHSQGGDESGRLPWEENKVDFDHFVDRKRWRMFYGRCYFLTMALMVRLYDEAHFYKELAKELQAQGVRAPEQKGADHAWHSPSAHEELETIRVNAFEAEVDLPPFEGEYAPPDPDAGDEELLALALAKSRRLIYRDIPWFRWSTRATEYAFHFYGNKSDGGDDDEEEGRESGKDKSKSSVDDTEQLAKKKPAWAKAVSWETDVKLPRKRIRWNRLVWAPNIGIRYRVWEKTEKVKPTESERRGATTSESEAAASDAESSALEESGSEGDERPTLAAGRGRGRRWATTTQQRRGGCKRRAVQREETGEEEEEEAGEEAAQVQKRRRRRSTKKKEEDKEEEEEEAQHRQRMKRGWATLGHTESQTHKKENEEEEEETSEKEAAPPSRAKRLAKHRKTTATTTTTTRPRSPIHTRSRTRAASHATER